MAKKKSMSRGGNATRRKARRRNATVRLADGHDIVLSHYNLLADPCGAPATRSAYRGKPGYMVRYTIANDFTLATTNPVAFMIINPGGGGCCFRNPLTSGTAASISYGGTSDASFTLPRGALPTIASGARAVACCAEVQWTGTELNRGGTIGIAVGPSGDFAKGGQTRTYTDLNNLAQYKGRVPGDSVKIRWVPTAADEEYSDFTAAVPEYFDDKGAILITLSNPAGVAGSYRVVITTVYEYLPLVGSGVPATTPAVHTAVGGVERIINLASRAENFITDLLHTGSRVYKSYRAVRSYVNNMPRIESYAAPLLLGA